MMLGTHIVAKNNSQPPSSMPEVLTVRVQLTLNNILHPHAIAVLNGLNKKVQADVIAGLLQRGAQVGGDGPVDFPLPSTAFPVARQASAAVTSTTLPMGGVEDAGSLGGNSLSEPAPSLEGLSLPMAAFDFSHKH